MDNFSNFYQFFFRQGRLFKWLLVKSKNKLIFHAFRFQSYDFLTDLNQVDKCCILTDFKVEEKKKKTKLTTQKHIECCPIFLHDVTKGHHILQPWITSYKGPTPNITVRCVNFPFFPPTFSSLLQCWHSNYSFMLLQSHVPLVHRETLHCAQTGNVALGR